MSQKKDFRPWFKLWVADWLFSERMAIISWEMKGIFIDLLALQWKQGGSLPSSHLVLQKLIVCDDATWERSGRQVVEIFFDLEGDRLVNQRLAEVWRDQEEVTEQRRAAGVLGGKAKAAAIANAKQTSSKGVTKAQQSPSKTVANALAKRSDTDTDTDTDTEKANAAAPPSAETAFSRMQREIFAYFKEKTGKSQRNYHFGDMRYAAMEKISQVIGSRAPEGVDPEFYIRGAWKHAIDKLAASDWHMGRDPKTNGKSFNDIMVIAKDVETFEKWLN